MALCSMAVLDRLVLASLTLTLTLTLALTLALTRPRARVATLSLISSCTWCMRLPSTQALKEYKFDAYTSKTTGATYPGGKVERELEEVCETADDFINLAYGRAVEARDGLQ